MRPRGVAIGARRGGQLGLPAQEPGDDRGEHRVRRAEFAEQEWSTPAETRAAIGPDLVDAADIRHHLVRLRPLFDLPVERKLTAC